MGFLTTFPGQTLERVMPALTALSISSASPLGRALAAIGSRLGHGFKRLADRIRNRRDAMRLAALDDRMLADIGLNRSDLRDAFAELPWRDPSEVLTRRAAERRASQRLSDFPRANAAVLFPARAVDGYPRLDRPARYLV